MIIASSATRKSSKRPHMKPLNEDELPQISEYFTSHVLFPTTTYTFFRYGQPLVRFDPAAEAKLLWKIDLYIVPTVSLLYLFCFIDRANIGLSLPSHNSLLVLITFCR
jgi:hypothetical protein